MNFKTARRFGSHALHAVSALCSLALMGALGTLSPMANVANAQTYQTPRYVNPGQTTQKQNSNQGGTDSTRINRSGTPYPGGAAYSGNGSSTVACNISANQPIIAQTSCPDPQVGTITTRSDYVCATGYEPGVYGAPYETARSCQSACWAFAKPASAYGPSDNAWTVVPFVTGVTDLLADPFTQAWPPAQTTHYITNSWVSSLAYVASEGLYCTSQPNPPIDYCVNMPGDQTAIPSNGYGTYSWNSSTMVCCPQAETQTLTCQAAGYPAGYAGSVIQSRSYACSSSSITPGAWSTSSNTCVSQNANLVSPLLTSNLSPTCGAGTDYFQAYTDANGTVFTRAWRGGYDAIDSGWVQSTVASVTSPNGYCGFTIMTYAIPLNGALRITGFCNPAYPGQSCVAVGPDPAGNGNTILTSNEPAAVALGFVTPGLGTAAGYGHTDAVQPFFW